MNLMESEKGTSKNNKNLRTATTISGEIQITDEEFSKLTFRQKFAVTEYGHLLSPEDAEQVGRMLGRFAKEKDILGFCQSRTTIGYINETDEKEINSWQIIGFLTGLIPGLLLYVFIYEFKEFDIGAVILICLGIPGGVFGAYLDRRSVITSWIAAFVGAILGAGLFIAFAISTCLICQ